VVAFLLFVYSIIRIPFILCRGSCFGEKEGCFDHLGFKLLKRKKIQNIKKIKKKLRTDLNKKEGGEFHGARGTSRSSFFLLRCSFFFPLT
jgi:hypothetical protein